MLAGAFLSGDRRRNLSKLQIYKGRRRIAFPQAISASRRENKKSNVHAALDYFCAAQGHTPDRLSNARSTKGKYKDSNLLKDYRKRYDRNYGPYKNFTETDAEASTFGVNIYGY